MEDFRKKFISDALSTIGSKIHLLNEYERKFYNDIKDIHEKNGWLSKNRYNTLQEIYQRVRSV